jgi:signal transduction histidine kinase
LTGIRQLGEMLARDRVKDESKRHQYYELIVHESERLARLVENVLDFSRMEAGRKQYRFEALNTASWLKDVAADFQIEASRSGYELQAQIPGDLPVISGDREALTTAVRNLLDNACKYSLESKSVWLDAEAADGGVRVCVRDRGVGIPAGELRQIFERFYRGGKSATRVKGVGLGLNLVQHIVSAHRGEVRVESREGEGSTFSILLRGVS